MFCTDALLSRMYSQRQSGLQDYVHVIRHDPQNNLIGRCFHVCGDGRYMRTHTSNTINVHLAISVHLTFYQCDARERTSSVAMRCLGPRFPCAFIERLLRWIRANLWIPCIRSWGTSALSHVHVSTVSLEIPGAFSSHRLEV